MMPTNEGPFRWALWKRTKLADWLEGGYEICLFGDVVSLRFMIMLALFILFLIPLLELDERIQSKKFAKGYNLTRRGILNYAWSDL